jgi:hypothetical protein
LLVVLPAGFALLEYSQSNWFWMIIFLGFAGLGFYGFFLDFKPREKNAPRETKGKNDKPQGKE